jgi:DNA-directed RNA polymerase subunit RPC12/RpoP
MAKKEKWVTICPKCGSSDISPESNPVYIESGLSTSYKQCENCGHHGLVFPQVPLSKVPKKTKPLSNVKNPTCVQTGYGEGYWKYLIYLVVPLAILCIVFWF